MTRNVALSCLLCFVILQAAVALPQETKRENDGDWKAPAPASKKKKNPNAADE